MHQKSLKYENFEIALIWAEKLTFPPHSHNEYIISCNISGHEKLTLDGRALEASETSTTLYNPGQTQAGDGTNCLASLYLNPNFFEAELISTSNIYFEKPVVSDKNLYLLFTSLVGFILSNHYINEAEEVIINIINHLLNNYTVNNNVEYNHDWRVKMAKEILLDDLSVTPTLGELAKKVSLNKLSFLRIFSNATGTPPITWQRHRRVAKARELLNKGMPIVDIAYAMGFSDQAHLTRQFSSAYGISPAKFARRKFHSR